MTYYLTVFYVVVDPWVDEQIAPSYVWRPSISHYVLNISIDLVSCPQLLKVAAPLMLVASPSQTVVVDWMATRALWLFIVAPQIKTADDSQGGSKLNTLPNIRMTGMTTIKLKIA